MLSAVLGSLTTNRSAGERPVRLPVVTSRAPVLVNIPSPRFSDASISLEGARLVCSWAVWVSTVIVRPVSMQR